MTTYNLDTGSNGIQLQLDTSGLKDADTLGDVTADTTQVRLVACEAWIDGNGYPFYDSSNRLEVSGGWLIDDAWNDISINTTNRQKLKSLGEQRQNVVFGSTNGSYIAHLRMEGVNASGTLDGSKSFTVPRRPYHAPEISNVQLVSSGIYIYGQQLTASADKYWASVDVYMDDEGVETSVQINGLPGVDWYALPALDENKRFRAKVVVHNTDEDSAPAYSAYYYTTPSTPTIVSALRQTTKTTCKLTLQNNSAYGTTFSIERSLNGGAWTVLGTTATTTYSDTNLPLAASAQYRVRSITPAPAVYSSYSATAAAGVAYSAPDAPATFVLTPTSLTLSGNQTDPAIDKYWDQLHIQFDQDGSGFSPVADYAGTTTYLEQVLAENSRWQGRAYASNVGGDGAIKLSNFVYTKPAAPTAFSAVRVGATTVVNLAWTNNAPWKSYYKVERSVAGGAWAQIGTPGVASFTDSLSAGLYADYRVSVVALGAGLQSDLTATVRVDPGAADKSKLPGIDKIYAGETSVFKIMQGQNQMWLG